MHTVGEHLLKEWVLDIWNFVYLKIRKSEPDLDNNVLWLNFLIALSCHSFNDFNYFRKIHILQIIIQLQLMRQSDE